MNNIAEKAEQIVEQTNLALVEMRIAFDTLVELQKTERLEMEKLYTTEIQRIQKHFKTITWALTGFSATYLVILSYTLLNIF